MDNKPPSLKTQQVIDQACDRFEERLRTEQPQTIESAIDAVDEQYRSALFEELLRAEIEFRIDRGDDPGAADYLPRFASYSSSIEAVFEETLAGPACLSRANVKIHPAPGGNGLHLRCPHCRNPIELVADTELDSIQCPSCGSDIDLISKDTATKAAAAVEQIAHFKLVEQVGTGAFGCVWKAYDTRLDRTVAIKIPRRRQFDPEEEKLFLREAQNAAQLSHPNIVPVYEIGREGDVLFIVSDFVRGVTLGDWLTSERPTTHEACLLCAKVAEALHHAHERGVIHRDLKPANIMLDENGEPQLMDFGLAKRDAAEIAMTVAGQVIGTPAYMSPEQAKGDAKFADRRSDVYSLGVILFEMLTGERPFRGNVRMLIHQVIHDEPPRLRNLDHKIHRDTETICLKCLEKDPSKRYATSQEVASECHRFCQGLPINARPIGPIRRSLRWCNRNRVVTVLLIAFFLSLAGGLVASSILAATANRHARQVEKKNADLQEKLCINLLGQAGREYDRGEYGKGLALSVAAHPLAVSPALKASCRNHINAGSRRLPVTLVLRDAVPDIAFSPDGKYLLTGTWSGEAVLWDISTGAVAKRFLGHENGARAVAYSKDGAYIATADSRMIRLWDAASGKVLHELEGEQVSGFSSDSSVLVTSYNGVVKMWDTSTGDELHRFGKTVNTATTQAALSPDSTQIITQDSNGFAILWDTNTGEEIRRFLVSQDQTHTLAFSPDGRHILIGGSEPDDVGSASLVELASGKVLHRLDGHYRRVNAVAFSPKGDFVLSAGRGGRVLLWDAKDGRLIREFFGHHSNVRAVAFSVDAKRVAACGSDGRVLIWETEPDAESLILGNHDSAVAVHFSPSGDQVVTAAVGGNIGLWSLNDGRQLTEIQQPTDIYSVAFSPVKDLLVTPQSDSTLTLRNARTGDRVGKLEGEGGELYEVKALAFTPEGGYLFEGGSRGEVRVWTLSNGEAEYGYWDEEEFPECVWALAVSPDGGKLLTAGYDVNSYHIRLWDVFSKRLLHRFVGHSSTVTSVAFSPDGKMAISGSMDSTVRLWDIETGDCIWRFDGTAGNYIMSVGFSHDGSLMYAAGDEEYTKVWDVLTRNELMRFLGNYSACVSDNSRYFATGDYEGIARLWEIDNRPPDSPDELEAWSIFRTGYEVDKRGNVSRTSADAWARRRDEHMRSQGTQK